MSDLWRVFWIEDAAGCSRDACSHGFLVGIRGNGIVVYACFVNKYVSSVLNKYVPSGFEE